MSKKDLTKKNKSVIVEKKRSVGPSVGTIGNFKTSTEFNKAVTDVLGESTTKKTISSEELEIIESNRDDTPLPAIQGDPVNRFMREMSQGDLPSEAEGRVLYIFHRETGQRMEHSLKLIMEHRKHAFQVWAKTPEKALEIFMKRTKWKKYMGDTPCPIPLPEKD